MVAGGLDRTRGGYMQKSEEILYEGLQGMNRVQRLALTRGMCLIFEDLKHSITHLKHMLQIKCKIQCKDFKESGEVLRKVPGSLAEGRHHTMYQWCTPRV